LTGLLRVTDISAAKGYNMRIGFIGPSYPFRGGIAQFADTLASKLQDNKHEVVMYNFKTQYPTLLFPGGSQFEEGRAKYRLMRERVLTPYEPFSWWRTVQRIRKWHPAAVIVSYWLPFFAVAFGWITKALQPDTKIVYLVHNGKAHEKYPFASILLRYCWRTADVLVTLSDTVTEQVKEACPEKAENIVQLYHPQYEIERSQPINSEVTGKLLYFGFIKPYKGVDVLLCAMGIVKEHLPNVRLTVAGQVYGDPALYLDLIQSLDIAAMVDWQDRYISNEEMGHYFEEADACILPYRSATQSGIAQLAYSYSVPVIATRAGGLQEMVVEGKTGYLANVDDPQDLANAIIRYYQDGNKKQLMDEIGKEQQKYSWEPFIEAIQGVLA